MYAKKYDTTYFCTEYRVYFAYRFLFSSIYKNFRTRTKNLVRKLSQSKKKKKKKKKEIGNFQNNQQYIMYRLSTS